MTSETVLTAQPGWFRSWMVGIRVRTLTATLVPLWVGYCLAYALLKHAPDPWLTLAALISALFIQIGTNLFNDALDFKRGADTEERVGPKRITQSGMMSFRTVWWGGLICFAISAAFAVPLLFAGGQTILWIGVASLVAGYLYTGGPYPLAYVGLGDVFVLAFFGFAAILGLLHLQGAPLDARGWMAGAQIGLLSVLLLAINNLRDHVGDRKAGKRTLAVRFGPRFGRVEIVFASLGPFALLVFWIFQKGFGPMAALPLLCLPLALRINREIAQTPPGPAYNRILGQAAMLQLRFGLLLGVGFLFSAMRG